MVQYIDGFSRILESVLRRENRREVSGFLLLAAQYFVLLEPTLSDSSRQVSLSRELNTAAKEKAHF
jgi:hypothetical protein